MLKDKRYALYYLFTATIVAVLLAIEDLTETGGPTLGSIVLEFFTDIPLYFLLCMGLGGLSVMIIRQLNRRLPWEAQPFRRFIVEILIVLGLVGTFTLVGAAIVRRLELFPDKVDDDLTFELLSVIMFFISLFMIFAFHEFMNLNKDKKQLSQKASHFEAQHSISQYEALKNQVNPHFLFNSLNVLSSLIYKDTAMSDRFISKFAEVFRYVLELNSSALVPLKQELQFIDSYIFLQQIRYGNCLLVYFAGSCRT